MIEIELKIEGNEVRAAAFSSRSERPDPHRLGPDFPVERLEAFAKKVGVALRKATPLEPAVVVEAQAIHEALFQGELRDVVSRAIEAKKGMPLLRFMIRDRALQKIPWEARGGRAGCEGGGRGSASGSGPAASPGSCFGRSRSIPLR